MPRLEQQTYASRFALGVRPEHIKLENDAPYRGQVVATEYLGTTQIVTLDTPNGDVKARIPSDQPARVGDMTGLTFNTKTLSLFDAETGARLILDRPHLATAGARETVHG
jgi:multiple sugar transport system ATP-binding protein